MGIARLLLDYVRALLWPSVAVFALVAYRGILASVIPGSKVKFTVSGITIETELRTLERSVTESLRGRRLTPEQWLWLRKLREEGRVRYDHQNYPLLRPLRNAGLLREHPEGHLTAAEEIEITALGSLLLDAADAADTKAPSPTTSV